MSEDLVQQLSMMDNRFGEEVNRKTLGYILEGNEFARDIGDRMIGFSGILKQGKFKIEDYMKAVQYCVLRGSGLDRLASWSRVFPERSFVDGVEKGKGTRKALASLYDKNDLVQMILAQSQVPIHMLFINERIRAAEVLAHLAFNSDNERIQMESADKFLYHVKPPETLKMELDMTVKSDETLQSIEDKLSALAQFAQAKIIAGTVTPAEVIEQ